MDTSPLEDRIIYEVIVGSTAYGLAHSGSDVDRLAVAVWSPEAILGLTQPAETHVRHEPFDRATHEVGKFCRLALKCNPTILEALYVDPQFIIKLRQPAWDLRGMRHAFLSRTRVRDSYGGYAYSQLKRLEDRDWARREKHARHVWRLMVQGTQLLCEGTMNVTLSESDADRCRWFSKLDNDEMRTEFERMRRVMADIDTPLPDMPNTVMVNDWLVDLRTRQITVVPRRV